MIQGNESGVPLEKGKEGITLYAPQDGGTPRDMTRIVEVEPREFLIRAYAEEGRNPLAHAVSRMDLVCRNNGMQEALVTLHIDLSGDGSRSNYNDNMFGGMPYRDFLFIQSPGQPWRQIDGRTEGWVCTVTFTVPPGDTKVGLSPWYTYNDYLRFVHSLPKHPHLQKRLIGYSDVRREHWELTITDPSVPEMEKPCIFCHTREHAYETFSSFAIEGLVEYLLSDTAAEARSRFIFVIHPMTNVDGVAEGYEYRTGYDFPEVRGTASARLTFDAVDRLRPDFIITWHNWIAPRDVDCLFYTDDEDGIPTRRAWDLFTQRFPSPRGVGHRWESEEDPLFKNWFGRPLDEKQNVHQYAMKRYGTRIWGWEMPWWGRSIEQAQQAGAKFAHAFLDTLASLQESSVSAPLKPVVEEVPRWEMHEFVLSGRCHVDNPFFDAALIGEFIAPSGKQVTLEGFYDGSNTWRLRFTPEEEGEWRYRLRGEGVEAFQEGWFRCGAPHNHGFIRIHSENPYAFAYADGTPFFPMGDTCYGLYTDSSITPELRSKYLKTRRIQHFNFVRMFIQHSPTHWKTNPDFCPWSGNPDQLDLDHLNPRFFQGLDAILTEMNTLDMKAELIVLNYYHYPFTNPKIWTLQRERTWLRYVVARYAAFPNLFIWTVTNEYETHPDGKYRLDVPDDPDWAKGVAHFIKAHDPYCHPVTVHPVISASASNGSTPKDPFPQPWRIGEFFGKDDAMDILSHQTSSIYAGEWDEKLQCWVGDGDGVEQSLAADRIYNKPVLNSENGYEYLRDYPTYRRQRHHTDKVRKTSWRIVCAGGYFAAGFSGTLGMGDSWNLIDAPNHYPFLIRDEGAAAQLTLLYDFFSSLPFWRMHPFGELKGNALVLAEPNKIYVIYLPHGGKVAINLPAIMGVFIARWFNPRDGKFSESLVIQNGGEQEFYAPDENDWVLIVKKQI